MKFEDWRDAEPDEMAPLYDAEIERYRTSLSWDYRPSCTIIESARRAGRLPGLVLRDTEGAILGWSFFVVYEGILQMGGLVAGSAAHLRRLLERTLHAPEARPARALSAFVFPVSASLVSAFERQRFAVEPHPYLTKSLGSLNGFQPRPLESPFRLRPLNAVDPADVVRLTARAYEGQAEARCFAPDGRLDQWAHYVGQLLATPACGTYDSAVSFAIERTDSVQVVGAVITTAVSKHTAHVAQIVVDPGARRLGLAQSLIESVCWAARAAGYSSTSLIVSGANAPARTLYARLGFTEAASFIFASRSAITRRNVELAVPSARSWTPAPVRRS